MHLINRVYNKVEPTAERCSSPNHHNAQASKMNVWKYTYIKFYKFRRSLLGETLAADFTSLLFVVGLDFLLYSGIVFLTDGLTGYHLLPDHKPLYTLIFLCGGFVLWMIHNHALRKNVASSMYLWSQKMIPVLFAVEQ